MVNLLLTQTVGDAIPENQLKLFGGKQEIQILSQVIMVLKLIIMRNMMMSMNLLIGCKWFVTV
jgi:hypothetical protein